MEKRPRKTKSLDSVREFFDHVIREQRVATEELEASTRELQAILDGLLASRVELRRLGQPAATPAETADRAPVQPRRSSGRGAAELKREADEMLEKGRLAVEQSVDVRSRARRLREALAPSAPREKAEEVSGPPLSKRERQVLALIVKGKTSKEIAAELGISFKTAVTHRASIMTKLDVHEIASVVREAIHRGLV